MMPRFIAKRFPGSLGPRPWGVLDTKRRLWVIGHNNQMRSFTTELSAAKAAASLTKLFSQAGGVS